jgi:LAO/AO transport system kinase
MELADALVINKADGDNRLRAQSTKAEYDRILHYLQPATEGWITRAFTCSSLTGEGVEEIWAVIEDFREKTVKSGVFYDRRRAQILDWVYTMVWEHLRIRFLNHPGVAAITPKVEQDVLNGKLSATMAVRELIDTFERQK